METMSFWLGEKSDMECGGWWWVRIGQGAEKHPCHCMITLAEVFRYAVWCADVSSGNSNQGT